MAKAYKFDDFLFGLGDLVRHAAGGPQLAVVSRMLVEECGGVYRMYNVTALTYGAGLARLLLTEGELVDAARPEPVVPGGKGEASDA